MKLTPAQIQMIRLAMQQAAQVLMEIQAKPLKKKSLTRMKCIEEAVVNLETALLI